MITWNKISLEKFQEIDRINGDPDLLDDDKALFNACEVFGITAEALNNMRPKKAMQMLKQMERLFLSDVPSTPKNRIGGYMLNYDPSSLTLGQYIELRFFLQDTIHKGQYALASIARQRFNRYSTDGHRERAHYFIKQPVGTVMGCLGLFAENLRLFNQEYSGLFGLDKELYEPGTEKDKFNDRYGWIYSASQVAEYERITMDAAFGLPIRQALNDLAYLKAKAKYEAEQQKKWSADLKRK